MLVFLLGKVHLALVQIDPYDVSVQIDLHRSDENLDIHGSPVLSASARGFHAFLVRIHRYPLVSAQCVGAPKHGFYQRKCRRGVVFKLWRVVRASEFSGSAAETNHTVQIADAAHAITDVTWQRN